MATIRLKNIIIKAKISVLEPICNGVGIFYYAGFVNDTYVHFLGCNKLIKRQIKENLLKTFLDGGFYGKKND